ncbi:MAG: ArsR/SmtB family transcription factor [Candidatus Limnocylindrales bacterium]
MMRTTAPLEPVCRTDLPVPDVRAQVSAASLLADHTRSTILAMLQAGPACVCEMAAALGERPNNVSNHLARLRDGGLVRASRHRADARWVYYERDEAACAAALADLRQLLEPSA